MKYNFVIILCFLMLALPMVSAEINEYGSIKQNQCITLKQTCASCTYVNFSLTYPNSTVAFSNAMGVKSGGALWTYDFCDTSDFGRYDVGGHGDIDGKDTGFSVLWFEVNNTNLTFFIILLSLAILFFVATLIVNEEFFVYISGVLFIIIGIYTMINGIDIINDWYSRAISYVCLGLGFLFTVGAYLYNSNVKEDSEED